MKVQFDGKVTIPKTIRESFQLTPGTMLEFVKNDGRVFLVRAHTESIGLDDAEPMALELRRAGT